METEFIGCGIIEHPESCLCDVVITNPLPPLRDCFKDGVEEMFMGKEMCEVRGYGIPWTDETILNYLEDLKTFYDEYHTRGVGADGNSFWSMSRLSRENGEMNVHWWKRIDTTVQYCMDNFNESLCEIVDILGLTPQQFVDAATGFKGGKWDKEKLEKLDYLMSRDVVSSVKIARELGATKSTIQGLRRFWYMRRFAKGQVANPARQLLNTLSLDPQYSALTTREICAMVEEKYGVKYSSSSVSKVRKRYKMKINGEDN